MSDDFASDGGGAGDDGGDLNVDTGGDSSGGAGTDFGGDLANDVGNASSGDAGADFGSDIASDAGADLNDDPDSNAETDLMGTGSADDLSAGADANAGKDDLGEDLNEDANDNVSGEAVDSGKLSDNDGEDLNAGSVDAGSEGDIYQSAPQEGNEPNEQNNGEAVADSNESADPNAGDSDTQGGETTDSGGGLSDSLGEESSESIGEDLNADANDNVSGEAVDSGKLSDNDGEDLNAGGVDGGSEGDIYQSAPQEGNEPNEQNNGEAVADSNESADHNAGDSDTQGSETTDSGGAGDVPEEVNSGGEAVADSNESADPNAGDSDTQGSETTDSGGAGDVPEDVNSGGKASADNNQSASEEEGDLSGDNALNKKDVAGETPKDQNVDALSKMSDVERNAYSDIIAKEPAITNDVKSVAELSGGELQGLEHRLKTPSSVYEKLHERGEDVTMGELNDVIRYTEIHSQDSLANGTNLSLNEYATKGYSVDKVKNSWLDEDATYRGINATLTSPDGQSFEVQYHTQESFDLKNGELHTLYEERRKLPDDSERAVEVDAMMRDMSSKLTVPSNIESVNKK